MLITKEGYKCEAVCTESERNQSQTTQKCITSTELEKERERERKTDKTAELETQRESHMN